MEIFKERKYSNLNIQMSLRDWERGALLKHILKENTRTANKEMCKNSCDSFIRRQAETEGSKRFMGGREKLIIQVKIGV